MLYDFIFGLMKGFFMGLIIATFVGIKKLIKILFWKIKGVPLVATFYGVKDWELVRDGEKIKKKINRFISLSFLNYFFSFRMTNLKKERVQYW